MGREQVLNNKRKHLEEENRRILKARRKVVAEDPHKHLSVHLPQEEESIGEGKVMAVTAGPIVLSDLKFLHCCIFIITVSPP